MRLHAVLPPVSVGGTAISPECCDPPARISVALCRSGAVAAEINGILREVIAARLAFLVSGGTGAGKTTLLAALLGAVSDSERIVCVEDAAELQRRCIHM